MDELRLSFLRRRYVTSQPSGYRLYMEALQRDDHIRNSLSTMDAVETIQWLQHSLSTVESESHQKFEAKIPRLKLLS
jgi:hypothetical protein